MYQSCACRCACGGAACTALKHQDKQKQLPGERGDVMLQRLAILNSDSPDNPETLQVICVAAGKRCTYSGDTCTYNGDTSAVVSQPVRLPYLVSSTYLFLALLCS